MGSNQSQPLALLCTSLALGVAFYHPVSAATVSVAKVGPVKVNTTAAPLSASESISESAAVYSQVAALYRQGKFEEALQILAAAKDDHKVAGDSFLWHCYQSALLFKTKPLIYPLAEARAAVKINSRNAVADTNLGILLQRNGERGNAIEKYRAAIAIDPTNWRAHLGVAQCLSVDGTDGRIIAEREMKLAQTSSSAANFVNSNAGDTAQRWSSLGATYLTMRMNVEAENCYGEALKLKPEDYSIKIGRLKAALAAGNLKVIKELLPTALTDKLADQSLALALSLPAAKLDVSELASLEALCENSFVGSDQFFYQLGRNLESSGQLDIAQKAYLKAIEFSGASSASVLALIGNRASAGQAEEANRLLKQYLGVQYAGGKAQPRNHKDIFAQALTYAGQILNSGSDPTLHIIKAVYSNIKCGCRIPVIELKLRSINGVIFAHLQDAKDPPACIIYDDKIVDSKTILASKRDEDKIEVISDQPVKSLPELVKIVQDAADKPDKHIFTLWSFEPPSMELPK